MNNEFMFQRLRDIREEKELTQNDIANTLKISRPNYTRWETTEKIIPLKRLNELCNFYKLSMDYVLNLSDNNNSFTGPKNLDKQIIGKNIKQFRKDNNITQVELANTLNTTHSNISAYENGKTLILTSFAYQICKEYNISMDWLCGRK